VEPIACKARLTILLTLIMAVSRESPAVTLGIDGNRFTLDGKPTYLLGMSYYAGTGAEEEFLRQDLDDLCQAGFNWIRVWATWGAFDRDVSAVGRDGSPKPDRLAALKRLIEEADTRGFVVDVTLSRGELLPTQEAHIKAVDELAKDLKPYRNSYFDLANERNVHDARFVSFEQLRALADRVKAIDPSRLVTASHGGDISEKELREYLSTAKVDFVCPHRPRDSDSPARTAETTTRYLGWMRGMGRLVPLHYQEPFRRGYGDWQPGVDDYLVDEVAARRAGAAGWCLHNGASRGTPGRRPRRSFDLRREEGRLMVQLDPVESQVIQRFAELTRRAGYQPH
jgi:hypothetical protein